MTKKVKYKRKTLRSKLPTIFVFLLLISCISWRVNEKQQGNTTTETIETRIDNTKVVYKSAFTSDNLVEKANKERKLITKINRAKNIKSDKIVASEFTETEIIEKKEIIHNAISSSNIDTIIVKRGEKPLLRLIVTKTN